MGMFLDKIADDFFFTPSWFDCVPVNIMLESFGEFPWTSRHAVLATSPVLVVRPGLAATNCVVEGCIKLYVNMFLDKSPTISFSPP